MKNTATISQNIRKVDGPLRVAWLCHYDANLLLPEIKFVRCKSYHPAPWIVNLVNELADIKSIDLHVILVNAHIERDQTIQKGGITFHVVKKGIKFLNRGYPGWFRLDVFTLFYRRRSSQHYQTQSKNPYYQIHSFCIFGLAVFGNSLTDTFCYRDYSYLFSVVDKEKLPIYK